jgi:hypothetical protein
MRGGCVLEKLMLQNYVIGTITASWSYMQSWSKGTTLGLLCHLNCTIFYW